MTSSDFWNIRTYRQWQGFSKQWLSIFIRRIVNPQAVWRLSGCRFIGYKVLSNMKFIVIWKHRLWGKTNILGILISHCLEVRWKILLVKEWLLHAYGSGKTSLLIRYKTGEFSDLGAGKSVLKFPRNLVNFWFLHEN